MHIRLFALAGSLALGCVLQARSPVATVSSSRPLEIRGVTVPADKLGLFPVSPGDEIVTRDAPATLQFTDGSRVTVPARARLRLQETRGRVTVQVLQGTAWYNLVPNSNVQVATSSGDTLGKMADAATVAAARTGAATPENVAAAGEVVYRASAAGARGVVLPNGAITTGTFVAGTEAAPTSVVLPNGIKFEVTVGANGAYTVNRILIPVTTPGGGTSFITVTSGSLIGATVSGGSGQPLSFTLPGQTTPLSSQQADRTFRNDVAQAVHDAIAAGEIPAGSTPASDQLPVDPGNFSRRPS